ncbi:hypothetical protein B0H13DRAFT_1884238 [Mycena leptocephala]|nr:hypothetical protein B0H13DRAFT_1884238 [Mycena leptocephala]
MYLRASSTTQYSTYHRALPAICANRRERWKRKIIVRITERLKTGSREFVQELDLRGRGPATKLGTRAIETGKKLEKENGNIDLKRTTTDHILKHNGRTWNQAICDCSCACLTWTENPRRTRLRYLDGRHSATRQVPIPGQHLELEAGQWEEGSMSTVKDTLVLHGVRLDEGTKEDGVELKLDTACEWWAGTAVRDDDSTWWRTTRQHTKIVQIIAGKVLPNLHQDFPTFPNLYQAGEGLAMPGDGLATHHNPVLRYPEVDRFHRLLSVPSDKFIWPVDKALINLAAQRSESAPSLKAIAERERA